VFFLVPETRKKGFSGGIVVDYPNSTKAKKMFLVLMCGQANVALPQGLDGEEGERDHVAMAGREKTAKKKRKKGNNTFCLFASFSFQKKKKKKQAVEKM
jgi:18S rRNA (guanine1575-N7)-methyltransferase